MTADSRKFPEGNALDVSSLLAGSRLLVLGGTGFVGKVFWAMLLDRYPGVGRIYLLVRASGGRSSEGRFWSQIATSEPFEPLRKTHGAAYEDFLREKIVVMDGDVGEHLCGLGEERVRELAGSIDAIVNVAGVVDFNPPLDEALDANARGTMHVVELAKALGNVPLLHTSTCYTAGRRQGPIVEADPLEIPFPRAAKPGESPTGDELSRDLWDADRELAECAEIVREVDRRADDAFRQSEFEEEAKKHLRARAEPTRGEALLRERAKVRRKFVSEQLVDAGIERAKHWGWPNIYTYTKSLGEQIIARSGIPYALTRPACCESTVEFPFVGWNEGISTSAPIIYLIMKGQVQLPLGDVPLDLIPTDYVCAGMILALAELLEGTAKPVYQLGGSDVNACSVARFGELTGLYKRKYYQRKGTGNPLVDFVQAHIEPIAISEQRFDAWSSPAMGRLGRELARAIRKTAPALKPAADALEGAAKREEKIANILKLFAPFTANQNGPFSCANVRAAHARLAKADKAKLPWAPEAIDWPSWFHTVHMPAMEKWILPEMDKKLAREAKGLSAHETLVALLEEMAGQHAHAPALTRLEKDGVSRVTYLELRARSRAVAARLAAAGVAKGDRVVLSAKNHPDWAIAYFGILRAGAVAVPIDPALSDDARANLIGDCDAAAVVSDTGKTALAHPNVFALHAVTLPDDALEPPAIEFAGGDVASLLYTSGTTGKPKGVKLTHANFAALVASLAPLFPLSGKDRVLSVLPLHHTFEFTCGLLLPLSRGAHVMYLDELSGHRLAEGLSAGKITAMVGVPALWQLLERRIVSEIESRGALASALFQAGGELNRMLGSKLGLDAGRLLFGPVHAALGGELRWLISGGAALPKETHEHFAKIGLPLAEGYGLTEAAPVLTVAKASLKAKAGNVGKPIPGVEVKIANPDSEGVGEVIARGANVMAGYTDEVATARAIDGEGWLHTGDLGKLDKHGRLVLVSRIKDVVVGPTGENVYPDDVEQRVGAVPGIAELAILGVGSDSGEKVACLAVPEKDGTEERGSRNERARAALRAAFDKLPAGQRPSIVHLSDQPLPRTATRKVKRDDVRVILLRKMAATDRAVGGGVTSEVRTAITAITGVSALAGETTLAGDLSFDSLQMAELLEALEARGRAIDPSALQACHTVGEVEALVGQEPAPEPPPPLGARSRIEKGERAEIVLPPAVQELGKRLVGKLQDAFYGNLMKARVVGRAFIPHNRSTIVVANHASHLDMGLVRHALGTYGEDIVSLAAQDYFFEGGLKKAFFANLTNLVALDRQGGLRAALRQASDVIASGKTVLLFPEGTRSTTGEIGEFKSMVGQLALAEGVDVLPVFLAGTHAAMPKGSVLPTKREVDARIGPPLRIEDLRRLTAGMSSADAAREVAKLARAAVVALQAGKVLDLAGAKEGVAQEEAPHPLVSLFAELEEKFNPEAVERPVSYYFTLGSDDNAKWTVKVDGLRCEVRPGKPDGGQADCVLKTSSEIFTKIVRESYMPGPSDFLSGAIKSNDVSLLLTFQKIFQLES
jgi:long-chain acyl-CoA synthetase